MVVIRIRDSTVCFLFKKIRQLSPACPFERSCFVIKKIKEQTCEVLYQIFQPSRFFNLLLEFVILLFSTSLNQSWYKHEATPCFMKQGPTDNNEFALLVNTLEIFPINNSEINGNYPMVIDTRPQFHKGEFKNTAWQISLLSTKKTDCGTSQNWLVTNTSSVLYHRARN